MAQILVVDDSSTIRSELKSFLQEHGLDVIVANDGEQGLAAAKEHPELKLIIADLNMPKIDGLTMIEKIRSEQKNTTVQILVLTTDNDPMLKARGKAAGVKGWIVKPFNGPAVIGPIKKMVLG